MSSPKTDPYLKRVLDGDAFLLFDGAFGTLLLESDAPKDIPNALLNIVAPSIIASIHERYVKAGCDVVTTNTFAASRLHVGNETSVQEVFDAAVDCARSAHPRYVAADIGPLGQMLEPYGDLSLEEAYELFAEQARSAQTAGADLIIIETMADLQEASLAIRACKDSCDLPVFATMTFGESGTTFMGATPYDAARELTEQGADALGINCSLGPQEILPLIRIMRKETPLPLIVQANAGLPEVGEEGSVSYPFSAAEYCDAVQLLLGERATIIGGCCGTDPSYIEALDQILPNRSMREPS